MSDHDQPPHVRDAPDVCIFCRSVCDFQRSCDGVCLDCGDKLQSVGLIIKTLDSEQQHHINHDCPVCEHPVTLTYQGDISKEHVTDADGLTCDNCGAILSASVSLSVHIEAERGE